MFLVVFRKGNVISELAIELDSDTIREVMEDTELLDENENMDVYKVRLEKVFER